MSVAVAAPAASGASLRFAGMRAVFERDFLVLTSRPRFLVLRTLTVAIPAALLVSVLAMAHSSRYMGSPRIGSTVYSVFMVVVPALLLLLSPVLAAPAIASERALHTLDIVLATPVSAYAFVLAKFASRLCTGLVLMAALLPLAAICFLYGGVSGALFVEMVAFAVGTAMLGTAAGTAASAWSRSVAAATTVSYLLAIVVPLLHVWTVAAIAATSRTNFFATGLLLEANPFGTWSQIVVSSFTGRTAAHPGFTFLAWTCLFAAIAIVAAGWRVRREAAHDVAPRGARRSASGLRFENPVIDRGLRGSLVARPRLGAWVMLALLVVLAGGMIVAGDLAHDLDEAWPHLIFLCTTTFVVAFSALSRAAHTLAAERETGALDMLLATRLTAGDVVWGKFAAILAGVAPLFAFALLYAVVAAALTDLRIASVIAWAAGAATVTIAFTAVGLWCSGTASTTSRAVLRAFALVIGGTVIHGVATGIVLAAAGLAGSNWTIPYAVGASPVAVGIMGPIVAAERRWTSDEVHVLVAWMLWTAAYCVAAVQVVRWVTHRIARRRDAT